MLMLGWWPGEFRRQRLLGCIWVPKYVHSMNIIATEFLQPHSLQAVMLDHFTFPADDGAASLPILSFWMAKPTEGFPPLVQFRKWCESIWFSFEKAREPLEVHPVTVAPGDMLQQGAVGLTKGFTRSAVILYAIIRTLMVEDMDTEPERDFFTQCPGFKQAKPNYDGKLYQLHHVVEAEPDSTHR